MELNAKTAQAQFSKALILFSRSGSNLRSTKEDPTVTLALDGESVSKVQVHASLPQTPKLDAVLGALSVLIGGRDLVDACKDAIQSGIGFTNQQHGEGVARLDLFPDGIRLIVE